MRRLFNHFSRVHLYLFLGFYVAFAAVTFLALNAGSVSDRRENWIVAATLGAVSGPFTGAIARHFQSCCLQFSLSAPDCVAFGAGVLFQIVTLPFQRFARAARLTLWCLGLLGWFGAYWYRSLTHCRDHVSSPPPARPPARTSASFDNTVCCAICLSGFPHGLSLGRGTLDQHRPHHESIQPTNLQ